MKFGSQSLRKTLAHLGGVFALLALMQACIQHQQIAGDEAPAEESSFTPVPITRPVVSQSPAPVTVNPNTQAITYYKDILPLFKLDEPGGRVYRCTVCHNAYMHPENVAKSLVMDDIIRSIEIKDGYREMPPFPGGMRPADLEILKLWRSSGMQIGTPN